MIIKDDNDDNDDNDGGGDSDKENIKLKTSQGNNSLV